MNGKATDRFFGFTDLKPQPTKVDEIALAHGPRLDDMCHDIGVDSGLGIVCGGHKDCGYSEINDGISCRGLCAVQ